MLHACGTAIQDESIRNHDEASGQRLGFRYEAQRETAIIGDAK